MSRAVDGSSEYARAIQEYQKAMKDQDEELRKKGEEYLHRFYGRFCAGDSVAFRGSKLPPVTVEPRPGGPLEVSLVAESDHPIKPPEAPQIGQVVRIINADRYKLRRDSDLLFGSVGTVLRSGTQSDGISVYGIEVPGFRNTASAIGVFWFTADDLEIVSGAADCFKTEETENLKGENIMNYSNCVNFVTVEGYGLSTKVYANYDETVKTGDLVVIEDHGKKLLAYVDGIEDKDGVSTPDHAEGEVVARVDMKPYEDRVQKRVKLREVKKKMEARAKKLQDIAVYKLLAKEDPEMAALLGELESLNG